MSEKSEKKQRPRGGDGRDWRSVKKRCPKCGRTKFVDPDFGVRAVKGIEHVQTWCKSCRAKGAKSIN